MTKVYQSFTGPVRHYLTVTDTRYPAKPGTNNNAIHYGIKHELKHYYVYMKKEGSSLGWKKAHGPFKSNYDAEQMILRIKIELAELCAAYHKMKEQRDANREPSKEID